MFVGKLQKLTIFRSLWGKFAEKSNLSKTKYVQSYEELLSYLTDQTVDVTDAFPVNENLFLINYAMSEEFARPNNRTNLMIACHVTAHARIRYA